MSLLVSELTGKFLQHVHSKRKPATHSFYAGRLTALDKMLGAKQVRRLKKRDMVNYLDYANHWQSGDQKGLPKAPDTVRANGAAIKQMQKFGLKKGLLKKPLIDEDEIPMPKGRTRDRLPTGEEIQKIRSASSVEFNLIYDALRRSGARPGEMARVTVADWDQVTGELRLQDHKTAGKTGQARSIAVGPVLAALFRASLGERTEGRIFLSPRKRAWFTQTISARFRDARKAMNLDRRLVLYTARHGHATAMYEAFGELATSVSLGHSTGMLGRYAKIPMAKRHEMQDSLAC